MINTLTRGTLTVTSRVPIFLYTTDTPLPHHRHCRRSQRSPRNGCKVVALIALSSKIGRTQRGRLLRSNHKAIPKTLMIVYPRRNVRLGPRASAMWPFHAFHQKESLDLRIVHKYNNLVVEQLLKTIFCCYSFCSARRYTTYTRISILCTYTRCTRSYSLFFFFLYFFFHFAVSLTKINTSYTPTNGTYTIHSSTQQIENQNACIPQIWIRNSTFVPLLLDLIGTRIT